MRKMDMVGGAVAALLGSLVAAAAFAAPITDDQLASLRVGVTTYDEVVTQFGRPVTVETTSDGSRTIIYTVTHARAKVATFVPVVGMFAGGAKGSTHVQRFEFDPKGVLSKVSTSDTSIECGIWSGCGAPKR